MRRNDPRCQPRKVQTVVERNSNAFGSWMITHWPPMPPEADFDSYVLHWRSADDHGYSIHPTKRAAQAAVPFTNEEIKSCPLLTKVR